MKKILLMILFVMLFVNVTEAQLIKTITKSKTKSTVIKSGDLELHNDGLYGPKLPGLLSIMASGLGPAYLFGDIGGSKKEQFLNGINDWNPFSTHFLYSVGGHYLFTNNFALKASLYFGNFNGTDIGSRNDVRGYAYKSKLSEATLQGEYVFWGGPFSKSNNPHEWYVFTGVGLMHNNTSLTYQGVNVTTTPIQRPLDVVRLNSTAPVIPLGLGYMYRFNDELSFGAEFGWHVLFSDYADGVNPINSKSNDALASVSLTVTYKIYGSARSLKNRCNCGW
jgi:hypothetical protein